MLHAPPVRYVLPPQLVFAHAVHCASPLVPEHVPALRYCPDAHKVQVGQSLSSLVPSHDPAFLKVPVVHFVHASQVASSKPVAPAAPVHVPALRFCPFLQGVQGVHVTAPVALSQAISRNLSAPQPTAAHCLHGSSDSATGCLKPFSHAVHAHPVPESVPSSPAGHGIGVPHGAARQTVPAVCRNGITRSHVSGCAPDALVCGAWCGVVHQDQMLPQAATPTPYCWQHQHPRQTRLIRPHAAPLATVRQHNLTH